MNTRCYLLTLMIIISSCSKGTDATEANSIAAKTNPPAPGKASVFIARTNNDFLSNESLKVKFGDDIGLVGYNRFLRKDVMPGKHRIVIEGTGNLSTPAILDFSVSSGSQSFFLADFAFDYPGTKIVVMSMTKIQQKELLNTEAPVSPNDPHKKNKSKPFYRLAEWISPIQISE